MSPKQGVRNPPSNQEGLQALKELLNSYENNQEANKLFEQIAVKFCLQLLHEKAPGNSVEVRIPPYAAVQVIPGTSHKRGTPPAVIEMSARIWIDLAIGNIDWITTKNSGAISASGQRADLSTLLPLISAQDLAK
jgi:Bacterial SCP ortholog